MKILTQCPVCNGPSLKPYSMKFQPASPHISRTRCVDCGVVFANPVASDSELLAFYTNYYNKGNFGALDYKKRTLAKFEKINTTPVTDLRKQYAGLSMFQQAQGGRLLDIGFGLGEQLYAGHKMGFSVYGTEFDQDCIDFLQPHLPDAQLFKGDLLSAAYANDFFDFVYIYHVIEHLPDPLKYISELHRILCPGGILVVGTPDIDAFAYRAYRVVNQLCFTIPAIVDGMEHTVVFNKKNLAAAFTGKGFEVKQQYNESLHDNWKEISASNMSVRKKIARYVQTKIPLNQVLICQKK